MHAAHWCLLSQLQPLRSLSRAALAWRYSPVLYAFRLLVSLEPLLLWESHTVLRKLPARLAIQLTALEKQFSETSQLSRLPAALEVAHFWLAHHLDCRGVDALDRLFEDWRIYEDCRLTAGEQPQVFGVLVSG